MKLFDTAVKTKLIATLVISIGISSSPLHAQIYRWVDENGVTNYSDEPIKTRKKEGNLEILEFVVREPTKNKDKEQEETSEGKEKPVNKAGDNANKKPLKELLSDASIKQILGTKDMPDDKQVKCLGLRRQLAALEEKDFATYRDEEGGYRVSWGDDGVYKGKREYLSRNEVAAKTTEITKQVKETCEQSDSGTIKEDVRAEWIRSEHCALNKVILADLKKPDLRTANTTIKEQEKIVSRYCEKLQNDEYRDDEDYYPKSFPARRKQ